MDPCSLSNFSDVVVRSYHWILEPDFSSKHVVATINIKAEVLTDGTDRLVLNI